MIWLMTMIAALMAASPAPAPAPKDCTGYWAARTQATKRPQSLFGLKVTRAKMEDISGDRSHFYQYSFTVAATFAQSRHAALAKGARCPKGMGTCYLPAGPASRFTIEGAGKASTWICMDRIDPSELYGATY